MKTPGAIANFDSAAAMLRATAAYLHGDEFPLLGMFPSAMRPLARAYGRAVNALPPRLREQVYIWSGWSEGAWPHSLSRVDTEHIARWVTSLYPQRTYPAVMVGSSNGALVHLCCALGVPWLPQSMLMPVKRRRMEQDDPLEELRWSIEPARRFLDANPDIALHHLHDPNQDRLMVERMAYFRFKRLKLGQAYEQFLLDRLRPGGTIFLVDCTLSWPTTELQDRHYFQFGALGQAGFRSGARRWHPPKPDADRPEAEWGFHPELADDVRRFARRHGFQLRRIEFQQPHDLSPFVADLYRAWNRARGVIGNRLLVESFVLMEPYLTVRAGCTPYWMVFNKEPSAEDLQQYLDSREAFERIYMLLFSHGVESVGLAPIERWRTLLDRARRGGELVGVDERRFPRDFAVFARYHDAIAQQIPSRYPLPGPLSLEDLDGFHDENEGRYRVKLSGPGHRHSLEARRSRRSDGP